LSSIINYATTPIKYAFDELINEKKTREELSSWALQFIFAEDKNNLEYDPISDEDKIWEGLKYLTGVDLKDVDGSYFHSIENFVQYKNNLFPM